MVIAAVIQPGFLTRVFRGRRVTRMVWVVNIVLIVWVAYALAQLTWRLIPAPRLPVEAGTEFQSNPHPARPAVSKFREIPEWHLFGHAKPVEEVPDKPIEAPETRLNLRLMGVLSSDEKDQARAIIADPRGNEESYRIGAQLPGDAELVEIRPDRVILLRNRRHETLRLEELPGVAPVPHEPLNPRPKPRSPTRINPDPQAREILQNYQEQLNAAPAEVMQQIRPLPVLQDGKFVGFRLAGREKSDLLQSVGLQPGDVITEVNGIQLTDVSKGIEVASRLQSVKNLDIKLLRGGQEQLISIRLP